MEGTHTAFEIHPNSVSLVRTGRFHSQMIFERDKNIAPFMRPPTAP